MKMRAIKDFLDPYTSEIHTVGREFDLPDEDLCEYLIGMSVLEAVEEEEPAQEPVKRPAPAPVAAAKS